MKKRKRNTPTGSLPNLQKSEGGSQRAAEEIREPFRRKILQEGGEPSKEMNAGQRTGGVGIGRRHKQILKRRVGEKKGSTSKVAKRGRGITEVTQVSYYMERGGLKEEEKGEEARTLGSGVCVGSQERGRTRKRKRNLEGGGEAQI